MIQSSDIVVVGCGVAAGYFCKGLVDGLNKLSVLVVGDEPHLPYERPALTKGYLVKGGFPVSNFYTCVGSGGEKLDEDYYKKHNIQFKLNSKIVKIDTASKTVTTSEGDQVKANKWLVLGMGSRSTTLEDFRMDVGKISSGLHYIRDVKDTDHLIQDAKSLPKGSNIVIIGGGYIGMESAAGLLEYGHNITMVFPEPKVMDRFMTDKLAKFYEDRYIAAGINIIKGDLALQIIENSVGRVSKVHLRSGQDLPADLVIVGVGARPNTELVKDQLKLLERAPGGIIVDANMFASNPEVLAIGEIAAVQSGQDVSRFEHVHYARQTAFQASESIIAKQNNSALSSGIDYHPYFYSRVLNMAWVLYGETPKDGSVNVHYVGDLSSEGSGKFAAFWVNQSTSKVVGGFLEGGTPEENDLLSKTVQESRSWPLKDEIIIAGAKIC